ncbi:MAG: DUF2065 domain-containing protein [Phyllobacteriaceae bacterium]|nr:DUF2065 domain-containing protein [Phyllobacteriaceae bacterium]
MTGPGASDFLAALGLVLVFEGAAYALMPGTMKRLFEVARLLDDGVFRFAGLLAVALGVAVVWLVRG